MKQQMNCRPEQDGSAVVFVGNTLCNLVEELEAIE